MTSNIGMTLLVALYFSITAFSLVAFQAHRHSVAVAASINLPR
jgi:hypothetical protein